MDTLADVVVYARYSSAGQNDQSLPTRGAWIEIFPFLLSKLTGCVAPHTGSVD